jgi:hypothetical protein
MLARLAISLTEPSQTTDLANGLDALKTRCAAAAEIVCIASQVCTHEAQVIAYLYAQVYT